MLFRSEDAELVGGPLCGARVVIGPDVAMERFPIGFVGTGDERRFRYGWYAKLVRGGEVYRDLDGVLRFVFSGYDE